MKRWHFGILVMVVAALGRLALQGEVRASGRPNARPRPQAVRVNDVGVNFIQGRVVAVLDGDTITVLDRGNSQHRIRFAGIDAPEKGQAFGQAAKKRLSDLVFGRDVRIEVQDQDRYGRTIGRVWAGDLDINQDMIRSGFAWAYRNYLREPLRTPYLATEAEARRAGRGLWRDPSPIPPWEWRRDQQ